ncbi:MAG: hypothetical protein AAGG68_13220 [Bacteroidota bacterium]
MQTRIYLLLLLCIGITYLLAQNTTIKPDKACINCQTDTLELGSVLRVKGNTKLEGTINIIAVRGNSSSRS